MIKEYKIAGYSLSNGKELNLYDNTNLEPLFLHGWKATEISPIKWESSSYTTRGTPDRYTASVTDSEITITKHLGDAPVTKTQNYRVYSLRFEREFIDEEQQNRIKSYEDNSKNKAPWEYVLHEYLIHEELFGIRPCKEGCLPIFARLVGNRNKEVKKPSKAEKIIYIVLPFILLLASFLLLFLGAIPSKDNQFITFSVILCVISIVLSFAFFWLALKVSALIKIYDEEALANYKKRIEEIKHPDLSQVKENPNFDRDYFGIYK